ncbi:hypothetical protein Cni_G14876 [Canna indica]|uniref:Protein kinase domain-containing protein n=1 Tax=Canna indica TaxID=4628 RepID=A0AAQ3KCF6_9LILI|nr:hypothetical protein Cni_G14876 [Canna indica]
MANLHTPLELPHSTQLRELTRPASLPHTHAATPPVLFFSTYKASSNGRVSLLFFTSPMSPLLLFLSLAFAVPCTAYAPVPNRCNERCGDLPVPFPFHLAASCGPPVDAFCLTCSPDSVLSLLLPPPADLRVVAFLPSGSLLLDYSPSPAACDPWYADVNRSLGLDGSPFFAITAANLLRLYDCEDSSICRTGCDQVPAGCQGNDTDFGCCYPLSDGSVWKEGKGLSVFAEFGCRGFSSWAVTEPVSGEAAAKATRGIEVEWAVPKGLGNGTQCAVGATVVNATAVSGGIRCVCPPGLAGDGFAGGVGCYKSCGNGEQVDEYGTCCKGRLCKIWVVVLAGVLLSATFLAAIAALCFFLRKPIGESISDLEPASLPKFIGKACNARQFTYRELNEATRGFQEEQKLFIDVVDGIVHTGKLGDGTLVAVERLKSNNQSNVRKILHRAELLSRTSHRNIARVIGFCLESADSLLVVYEHFSNGTLVEHLRRERGSGLGWYLRARIASEVASALAYLQYDISTPCYVEDLKTSDVLLDEYHSAKIAGFEFLKAGLVDGSCSYVVSRDRDVVRNFGLLLLELVMGSDPGVLLTAALSKIEERKIEEIVDPFLGFGERLPLQREQMRKVAELVVRCLSSKENGGPCMVDVAREMMCIVKDNVGGSSSSSYRASF